MLKDVLYGPDKVKGRARAYEVFKHEPFGGLPRGLSRKFNGPEGLEDWCQRTAWRKNLVTFEWGAIVGRALTLGEMKYRLAGMYLEFENTAAPGDPVAIPSLDRTRDIEYYNDLSGSSNRDYLRVALTAHTFGTSDVDVFAKGNQPVFFARSQGLEGVHGKPFSHVNNSTIFGASLIAMVDGSDATQDLVFSSFYFDTDDQQPKLSTSQVGIEWELTLQ